MQTRRRFLGAVGAVALAGCADGSGEATDGADGTAGDTGQSPGLAFTTPAFADGGTIPERHTGVGPDVSPALTVESVPADAETLALVVDDPDANGFVHWLLWNVPAAIETIPEGVAQEERVAELDDARQGENDFGELGYRGPLPPADDGPHTYRFEMSAVETTLELPAGSDRGDLDDALDGRVVDTHTLTGTFDRE